MLDDKFLLEFANGFYGYGNYQASCWFLGMEEGGGNSVDEINRRLFTWKARGGMELEDMAEYHVAIGIPAYFGKKPKIQNTWGKQIRFLFGTRNQPVSTDTVREYQRTSWGRKNDDSCIFELFPLPSPGTSVWIYGQESALEILKDRETYRNTFFPNRASHIRRNIEKFQPKIICAFGITYLNYWEALIDGKFHENEKEKYFYSNIGETKFVVLQHPAAIGVTSEYFYNLGRMIAGNPF
ncbi:MAG: hypothetical protein IPP66_10315 [Anaerolineales bacterium]|nr:hypothetical protein [Anaerolineales bacterium]